MCNQTIHYIDGINIFGYTNCQPKTYHYCHIKESVEAGLVLTGIAIESIWGDRANLRTAQYQMQHAVRHRVLKQSAQQREEVPISYYIIGT